MNAGESKDFILRGFHFGHATPDGLANSTWILSVTLLTCNGWESQQSIFSYRRKNQHSKPYNSTAQPRKVRIIISVLSKGGFDRTPLISPPPPPRSVLVYAIISDLRPVSSINMSTHIANYLERRVASLFPLSLNIYPHINTHGTLWLAFCV